MNEKILVIDDEEVIRSCVQKILTKYGYLVKATGDCRAALDVMDREDFDVVLVDLKMPEINGMEIAMKIKEKSPRAGIIIITGYMSYEIEKEIAELGIENYLVKPFGMAELAETVKKCLKKQGGLK
ncbi:MAG: response regulator [bacterium]